MSDLTYFSRGGNFGLERKWHSDDVILQRAKFGQDTERKRKISNQTHVDDFGGFVVIFVVSTLLCWPKINRTCVLTLLTHRCHTTEFATQNPIHTFIYKRLTCKNGVRFLFLETRNGQYCHSGEFVGGRGRVEAQNLICSLLGTTRLGTRKVGGKCFVWEWEVL